MNYIDAAIGELRADSLDAAEVLLARALEREVDRTDALHFTGLLRHAQCQLDEAIGLIREVLGRQPANSSAWNKLGNVCMLAGRTDDAADAYAHAVEYADAGDAALALALANLGALYRKLGRLGDCESACRRAIEIAPECVDAWYQLSATLIRRGRVHDGLLAYSRAVTLWPELLQSRGEIARAARARRVHARSAAAARLARKRPRQCGGRASARRLPDGRRRIGASALKRCLRAAGARQCRGELRRQARSAGLTSAAAARAGACTRRGAAGNGTRHRRCRVQLGLVGPVRRAHAPRLAGCDLSVGMLRRAQARKMYDVLHQEELASYLRMQPQASDTVVSANTLFYSGAFDAVLIAAKCSLKSGGILVLTVEALPKDDVEEYRLQTKGRYAHGMVHMWAGLASAGLEARAAAWASQ